jgi:hypothetical protein
MSMSQQTEAERDDALDLALIELRHLTNLPDTDNELGRSVFTLLFAAIIASENGYDQIA